MAAIFYDAWLILALWLITSTPVIFYTPAAGNPAPDLVYQFIFCVDTFAFYLLFWRTDGQTLGMQAWKIKLQSGTGHRPGVAECSIRLLVASLSLVCFGLGFLWMLWDKDRLTWQDRLSGTRIVFLGKQMPKK